MQRLITCQNATLLLEQHADHLVPNTLVAALQAHLHYCPYCKRYAEQTLLVAQWARGAASVNASAGPVLSAAAKARMRQRLTAAG